MWELRRFTTLWASKACYKDSFTFYAVSKPQSSAFLMLYKNVTLNYGNLICAYWTELHGLSPQANYTDQLSDRRLWAKLVPTLADRGCCVVISNITIISFHESYSLE
jgi:hypothetical protein